MAPFLFLHHYMDATSFFLIDIGKQPSFVNRILIITWLRFTIFVESRKTEQKCASHHKKTSNAIYYAL